MLIVVIDGYIHFSKCHRPSVMELRSRQPELPKTGGVKRSSHSLSYFLAFAGWIIVEWFPRADVMHQSVGEPWRGVANSATRLLKNNSALDCCLTKRTVRIS